MVTNLQFVGTLVSKSHVSIDAEFESYVIFFMKILVGDRCLYLYAIKWTLRSDVDGLTHTKQLLIYFA